MIGVSSIPLAGDGVWTAKTIKKDTLFGPYEGVFRKKTEDGSTNYSWEIKKERKPVGFVDALDIATSNWMRFVNCARSTYEQNLVAHQYKGKIYYRAFDDIPPNRELFVYYGSKFAEEQLGIENFKENKDLPQSVFLCPHCAFGFSSLLHLNNHSKVCRMRFLSEEEKEKLKRKKLPQSPTLNLCSFDVCVICNSRVLPCGTAQKASKKCDNCVFKDEESILLSMKKIGDKKRPFSCTYCDKKFTQSGHLNRHLRTHTGDQPFSCTYCDKKFTQSGHLYTHLRTHTGDQPFSCTYCDKKFTQSGTLNTHLRTHTGDKPFSCIHCDKKFTKSSNLNRHRRTHTGDQPFSCTYCDKKFTESGTLNTHLRTHTGDKPFSCTHCDKKFTQSGHLNRHLRTHTGDQPFSCTYCDKKFTKCGTLNTHLRTHTGDKPFSET
ncbi:unnamed protein product [Bemisia tabaci]|uniref:Uncharacterized protein n=1 Tax=Bemisia tabaci TaxID=7038 RepID=A0AAI8Y5Z2_BEMTA|nr:unnamed protein product [Bemisia tabaci]